MNELDRILDLDVNLQFFGERGEKGLRGLRGERGERGFKGDKGDKGERGERGERGESGKNGIDGRDGRDGINGIDGKDGEDGENGLSAYEVWLKTNEGTEEDFLKSLKGKDGKNAQWHGNAYTELKELADTSILRATDGQALVYDASQRKWIPGQDISTDADVTFNSVTAQYIDFDTAYAGAMQEGRMSWNADDGTLQVGMPGGVVNYQLGQEELLLVRNTSGAAMTNGQLVYISGATGNRPTVSLAQADLESTADRTIGMLTEDISNNQQGFITTFGLVREVDTSLYTAGTELFLSDSVAGGFTGTAPTPPNHKVRIGYVLRQHATEGIVLIEIEIGEDLEGLHDVKINSLANGNVLKYVSSTETWDNGFVADSEVTFTDITTNNTSTSAHGYAPKLPGDSSQFLDGNGNWTTPTGIPPAYIEQSFTSQTSVTVTHNFGRMVQVYVEDASRNRIHPNNEQNAVDYNSITLTFTTATTGKVLVS